VELVPEIGSGRAVSEAMAARGVLVKETHDSTLRFAPPIVITREEIDLAVDALAEILTARLR
jgi:ornithine--oxo-acid transaminase